MRQNKEMNPFPRTWVEIDLPALGHNLGLIRKRIGPDVVLSLVAKADAYGHGIVPIARYAVHAGVDWIAVATIQEGVALRDAGLSVPLLVLSPILEIECDQAVFYGLHVMVERIEFAQALDKAASEQGKIASAHIKVDTGVSRFGCLPSEVAGLLTAMRGLKNVEVVGIATHFADSGFNRTRTEEQIALYDSMLPTIDSTKYLLHIANSAGATMYPNAVRQLVRTGIAAYGIDPYGMFGGESKALLAWKARVTSVRTREKGTLVSYSGTFECPRTTKLATLGVGYGDGYPRSLSNCGIVEVNGHRAPVVGLVCMDQMLIDVTDVPNVEIGDDVHLVSKLVKVEELAQLAKTNVHEITTRIMSRVPRRYRYE